MRTPGPPQVIARLSFTVAAVAIVVSLAGCSAPNSPVGAETAMPSTTTPTAAVSDQESCEAFGDVLTIITNAEIGVRNGRMSQQERDGWYRLATRVLDRVPTTGDGAVSDTIDAMKEVAPVVRQGAIGAPGIGTDAWMSAGAPLLGACIAAGSDLASESFTGG